MRVNNRTTQTPSSTKIVFLEARHHFRTSGSTLEVIYRTHDERSRNSAEGERRERGLVSDR
jgi:hypothetical protein